MTDYAHIHHVDCNSGKHRIGITDNGEMHLLDCDAEEEEAKLHLGDDPCNCFILFTRVSTDPSSVIYDSINHHDIELLELVLKAGFDIRNVSHPCFLSTCYGGDTSALRVYIENCELTNSELRDGIQSAAAHGWVDAVRLLSKHGANPTDVHEMVTRS